MKFLSVCSGIEAASSAWNPLGWEAVAFSEIEPFPCAVLAHHYPDTPNWGDMTQYKEWPDVSIDLLCGGTPCQSFSVAGLRKGLDDPRGNLMLTFGAIAAKYRPKWLVWENVYGVLSSNGGRDFGSFLGLLGVLGYGFAYRVLDAQYFGVAQRRRRVFVVGCLGDWRSAAAVLFERHSLSGHPAPSREKGKGLTHSLAPSLTASGRGVERSGDTRGQDPVVAIETVGTPCADAHPGSYTGQDAYTGRLIPHPHAAISPALKARDHKGVSSDGDGDGAILVPMLAHSLRGEGFDAGEDGTGRGTPLVPVGCDVFNGLLTGDVAATMGTRGSSTTASGPTVLAFDTTQITSAANYSNPKSGDPCHPLAAGAHAPGIAYTTKLHNTGSNNAGKIFKERTTCLDANSPPPALLTATMVRRLTPEECEALQGFPRGHTAIPWRGKPADQCPDGPRYKSIGNSWAVPCARWIGERIEAVQAVRQASERDAA